MKPRQIFKVIKNSSPITYREISDYGRVKFPEILAFKTERTIQSYINHKELKNYSMKLDHFWKLCDSLGCYVVVIPKRDFCFKDHPTALRLDDTDYVIEFKGRVCPNCGHALTKKEKSYKCCPYCIKPYIPELKQDDKNTNLREKTLEEKLNRTFNYES